ncbi:MAG: hypothetical protein WC632_02455 [Candidatus Margulisiibacteriota bacterium]
MFKTTRILPLLLTLSQVACSQTNRPSKLIPAAAEINPGPVISHHANIAAAFRPLMARLAAESRRKPFVLAIGGAHGETRAGHSTNQHIAREILPGLAEFNSRIIVWEYLQFGNEAHQSIETYKKTGRYDEQLAKWLNIFSENQGLDEFMASVRQYGFILFGSNLIDQAEKDAYPYVASRGPLINQRSRDTIDRLVARGLSVVAINGYIHNDTAPLAGWEPYNYGAEFSRRADINYLELDIIIPEFFDDFTDEIVRVNNWKTYVPKDGVTQVHYPRENRYVFILPRQ